MSQNAGESDTPKTHPKTNGLEQAARYVCLHSFRPVLGLLEKTLRGGGYVGRERARLGALRGQVMFLRNMQGNVGKGGLFPRNACQSTLFQTLVRNVDPFTYSSEKTNDVSEGRWAYPYVLHALGVRPLTTRPREDGAWGRGGVKMHPLDERLLQLGKLFCTSVARWGRGQNNILLTSLIKTIDHRPSGRRTFRSHRIGPRRPNVLYYFAKGSSKCLPTVHPV